MKVSSLSDVMEIEHFTEKQIAVIRKWGKVCVSKGTFSFNQYRLMNSYISSHRIDY